LRNRSGLTDVAVHHRGIVEDVPPGREVRVGIQFGFAYTPAILVEELGLMARRLPGARVVLRQFGSGAEVTRALAAGEIDVGIMGVAPFLIARAAGRPWRVAAALGDMPVALNTVKPGATSLRDVAPTDRIALPGIGSIQHVVLALAAEQQLGRPRILDANLVALDHPTGEQALRSGMVAFHLSAPPFQDREVREGARRLFDSYQVLGGPHSLNVAVVPDSFVAGRPDVYRAFVDALADAVALIPRAPVAAAQILQRRGEPGTVAQIAAELTGPGIRWTVEPHRLAEFAAFMQRAGFFASP
jgi:NitT/TauT family transport system substrate-binding protein